MLAMRRTVLEGFPFISLLKSVRSTIPRVEKSSAFQGCEHVFLTGDRRDRAIAGRRERGGDVGVAAGRFEIVASQQARQERTVERVARARGVDGGHAMGGQAQALRG